MAGAGDHAGVRADRPVEISLPTARQGRSGFDLFEAYAIRGVSVAIPQVKIAAITADGALEFDVQAVGDALDDHVLQVGVRDQERRGFAEVHLHGCVCRFTVIHIELQRLGLRAVSGFLDDIKPFPRYEVLLQDYLGGKLGFVHIGINEKPRKAERGDNRQVLFEPELQGLPLGFIHKFQRWV